MSRILKAEAGRRARPPEWEVVRPGPAAGVVEFRPPGVGGPAAEPEPERPPAAEPAARPEPPPPDLDAIRREAFQEGYRAGEQAGAERVRKEVAGKMNSLGQVVEAIAGCKPKLRAEAEREVVELAFAVARRILRRESTVDPTMTLAMVKACLEEFPAVEVRRIAVHPRDVELLRSSLSGSIEIVGDESIAPGGAALETAQGRLDARVESQLDELLNGLADR